MRKLHSSADENLAVLVCTVCDLLWFAPRQLESLPVLPLSAFNRARKADLTSPDLAETLSQDALAAVLLARIKLERTRRRGRDSAEPKERTPTTAETSIDLRDWLADATDSLTHADYGSDFGGGGGGDAGGGGGTD